MAEYDLVIRGGTVVDGTGAPPVRADVAVTDGRIAAVGEVAGRGAQEIEAAGLLVTPGFVDIHTHYDGQATWDSLLDPTSWHGVTSIVMGNCGVGFAPVAPDRHDFLIALMEGVEDIPGAALSEGLAWGWETFPEYLDVLAARQYTIDLGAQLPHAPLRAYVMGDRGADHTEVPTDDEIARMRELTRQAMEAGAVGFGSSRAPAHRSRDGAHIGSFEATDAELSGIVAGLSDAGRGVVQFVYNRADEEHDIRLFQRLARESGRPLSFTLLNNGTGNRWRWALDVVEETRAEGIDIKAQVCLRPVGVLLGHQATLNPFMLTPSFRAIADLSFEERIAALRQSDVRDRILEEHRTMDHVETGVYIAHSLDRVFRLGDPPVYEPDPADSVAAQAAQSGREPAAIAYDVLLERDGRELLYCPGLNYADNLNFDTLREMVLAPGAILGLSDGGAHVGTICDASFPTYNLAYWCRDRVRGPRLPVEFIVKRQTSDPARHVGWLDRGVVAPGYRADLNVIDFDRLTLRAPHIVNDLPAGGRRLLQEADGYRYTIAGGEVTFIDGKHTGALPGRLVRGQRPAPAV